MSRRFGSPGGSRHAGDERAFPRPDRVGTLERSNRKLKDATLPRLVSPADSEVWNGGEGGWGGGEGTEGRGQGGDMRGERGDGGREGGCTQFVHGRSRMTIDPRISTMPGRITSGFHQPGRWGRGGIRDSCSLQSMYNHGRFIAVSGCRA